MSRVSTLSNHCNKTRVLLQRLLHMNVSCHVYASHVTYEGVMSRMNEAYKKSGRTRVCRSLAMCLQCVAVCCRVLQCIAVCCRSWNVSYHI